MASRSASRSLSAVLACAALLATVWVGATSFVSQPATNVRVGAAAAVAGAMAPLPVLAGDPPSVGDHWYWDLGFGSLHGETASIILLVFFLLLVFALLGAGGSSRKSTA